MIGLQCHDMVQADVQHQPPVEVCNTPSRIDHSSTSQPDSGKVSETGAASRAVQGVGRSHGNSEMCQPGIVRPLTDAQ